MTPTSDRCLNCGDPLPEGSEDHPDCYRKDVSRRAPLSREEVEALPEGTPIMVVWSGGNGPHRYRIHVEGERRYAVLPDWSRRSLPDSRLEFVGQETYHTRVWRLGESA